jgi:hypothetical protein
MENELQVVRKRSAEQRQFANCRRDLNLLGIAKQKTPVGRLKTGD